jgi:integrase
MQGALGAVRSQSEGDHMTWTLTKRSLAAALAQRDKKRIYKDASTRGLYLIVSPRAARFEYRFKLKGSNTARTYTIGLPGHMSLEEVRQRAVAAAAARLVGEDPRPASRVPLGTPTLSAVFDIYTASHLANLADRTRKEVLGDFRRDILPKLGNEPLQAIPKAAWITIMTGKAITAPGSAPSLYRRVNAFLNWAEAREFIDRNPMPRGQHLVGTDKPRDRVITPEEIAALWHDAGSRRPCWCALVRTILMTAQRRGLVTAMRWEDIDLEAGIWCPPVARKAKARPRMIPLHPLLLAEISALDRGEFVFSTRGEGPPKNMSKLRDRMTVPGNWTWHDIRRSFRSSAKSLGISMEDAEAALGHTGHKSKLARIYDVSDDTEDARLALVRWQAYVESLVTGDQPKRSKKPVAAGGCCSGPAGTGPGAPQISRQGSRKAWCSLSRVCCASVIQAMSGSA